MEPDRLKQRLVGAAVLVALAVIFVPMLLSGPDPLDQLVMEDNIPERPADRSRREVIDLDEEPPPRPETPQTPAIVDEHTAEGEELPPPRLGPKVVDSPAEEDGKEEVAAGELGPEIPEEGEPGREPETSADDGEEEESVEGGEEGMRAWAIQVGSFRDRGNAMNLRDRLRDQDFSAYVEGYHSDEEEVYRVRVGPAPDRDAAKALQEELRQDGGVRGMVVRHGLDEG
ncbi:SPOR domain-containing protein [Thiohalospira sp.]|uniref:SPOR domain-containing protein n=1 Tax=Thiohalospira sp. TaxID=3080549 RepID=UPI0039818AE3